MARALDAPQEDQQEQEKGEDTPYRWWVLVAVATGSFMSGLDSSVSNTVLPVISGALNADVASVQWVVLIYLLVVSALLLSAGRLGDMRGHRGVYLSGFGLFIVSSAACAAAPSVGWLVAARGLQAIGAALLASNSPAILTGVFPESRRGRVLGLQGMAVYLGLLIGPALGGLLTTAFGWPSVFLINVPVGLVGVLLSWRFVPRDAPRAASGERFDLAGAGAFAFGLVLFILGLNQAPVWGWTSPLLLGCLAVSIASLATFVWIERRTPGPMLDLNVFKHRLFTAGVTSATLTYVATFAMGFLLPFYLIQARGLSPAQAGLVLTAVPILMPVLAAVSGALSDRIGSRLPATAGMLTIAVSLLLLSRIDLDTPMTFVVGGLVLMGMGSGMFSSPNTSAVLGAAPREQRGVASGVVATARNLGMVVGLAIGGAIFTTILARAGGQATPAAVAQAADAGLLGAAAIAAVAAVLSAIREPARAATVTSGPVAASATRSEPAG
jgi:EmrB/QacA subfamily drug resistance transporter